MALSYDISCRKAEKTARTVLPNTDTVDARTVVRQKTMMNQLEPNGGLYIWRGGVRAKYYTRSSSSGLFSNQCMTTDPLV